MNEDKSYVGMATCFVCGEVKHLLLDRRLKNSLQQSACYDKEPCDKCKDLMKQGIIFISTRSGESGDNPYRTGRFFVVKDEAVKRMPMKEDLRVQILKKRIAFVEDEVLDKLGFPKVLKEASK